MLLHFLCAEQKNMTNAETAQSPEVKMLVLYTARYHVGQKGMQTTRHGAINRLYGLNMTDSLGMGANSIIGAALFIAECANVMLNFPKECPTVKDSINNAADQIGTLFATMHLKPSGMALNVAAK